MPSSSSPRRPPPTRRDWCGTRGLSSGLARGDADGALEDLEVRARPGTRDQGPQRILPSLVASARGRALLGHEEEARELAHEALQVARENVQLAASMHDLDVVAGRLGIREELREVLELAPEGPWKDWRSRERPETSILVADTFVGFGARSFEAENRLFGGESLIEGGRRSKAKPRSEQALEFYRSVGAHLLHRDGAEAVCSPSLGLQRPA